MKKTLILTAVGILLAIPATAVQKCVALNTSSTTCVSTTELFADTKSTVDWTASCTTNGATVAVKGIGVCSSSDTSSGVIRSSVETSRPDDQDNVNMVLCWCKMTYPAVSKWVFTSSGFGAGCTFQCAHTCASYLQNNTSDFRTKMFSSFVN